MRHLVTYATRATCGMVGHRSRRHQMPTTRQIPATTWDAAVQDMRNERTARLSDERRQKAAAALAALRRRSRERYDG